MTTTQKLIEDVKEQRDRDAAEHCPAEIIELQDRVIAALQALQAEVDERDEMLRRIEAALEDVEYQGDYVAGIEVLKAAKPALTQEQVKKVLYTLEAFAADLGKFASEVEAIEIMKGAL